MRSLAILTYHSVDTSGSVISVAPGLFAEHMARLADLGVRGLTLSEAVAHRSAHGVWPDHAVVLTFDDGYLNFYDEAFPVLLRHRFNATLFVVSGHIGGLNDWAPAPPGLGTRPLLTWDQLSELATAGMEIGSHGKTHADLQRLGPDQVAREIVGSRTDIEARLGRPVETFAYPFGAVSAAARTIVRSEYRAACTTVLKRVSGEELYELPRVDMYYLPSRTKLEALVRGRLESYLAIRRWARAIRAQLRPH